MPEAIAGPAVSSVPPFPQTPFTVSYSPTVSNPQTTLPWTKSSPPGPSPSPSTAVQPSYTEDRPNVDRSTRFESHIFFYGTQIMVASRLAYTVGGQPATVTFDGSAPTLVDGVDQLNIQLSPNSIRRTAGLMGAASPGTRESRCRRPGWPAMPEEPAESPVDKSSSLCHCPRSVQNH
jgi:hypothetical protein